MEEDSKGTPLSNVIRIDDERVREHLSRVRLPCPTRPARRQVNPGTSTTMMASWAMPTASLVGTLPALAFHCPFPLGLTAGVGHWLAAARANRQRHAPRFTFRALALQCRPTSHS